MWRNPVGLFEASRVSVSGRALVFLPSSGAWQEYLVARTLTHRPTHLLLHLRVQVQYLSGCECAHEQTASVGLGIAKSLLITALKASAFYRDIN